MAIPNVSLVLVVVFVFVGGVGDGLDVHFFSSLLFEGGGWRVLGDGRDVISEFRIM